jgi:hypothetical protein
VTALWTKRGLIYATSGEFEWSHSHAQVPVVDPAEGGVWRIYYASRDRQNRARVSYLEVEAENPGRVLYVHPEPILPLGPLGTFDDCGVMPASLVRVDESTHYLYFIGLTVGGTVPYQNALGLAVSRDGGRTFERLGDGPIFGPTLTEPYFTGTTCVRREDGIWKSWYLSCTKWEMFEGKPEPFYDIKYAESEDGVEWRRSARVAISLRDDGEAGLVSPSVIFERGRYRMWYARRKLAHYRTDRTTSYRIGYAESSDGIEWTRRDDAAAIDVSETGWDSAMIAYPNVIVGRDNRKFMFYNGNGFGQSGFGYATLDEPVT